MKDGECKATVSVFTTKLSTARVEAIEMLGEQTSPYPQPAASGAGTGHDGLDVDELRVVPATLRRATPQAESLVRCLMTHGVTPA